MSGTALAIMLASIGHAYGLPEGLLPAVCYVESGYRTQVVHRDDGGPRASLGLCQVQLRTARALGFKGTARDLMDPVTNAAYAAAYLQYQHSRYTNWNLAVIAYNRGNAVGLSTSAYLRKVQKALHEKR